MNHIFLTRLIFRIANRLGVLLLATFQNDKTRILFSVVRPPEKKFATLPLIYCDNAIECWQLTCQFYIMLRNVAETPRWWFQERETRVTWTVASLKSRIYGVWKMAVSIRGSGNSRIPDVQKNSRNMCKIWRSDKFELEWFNVQKNK